MFDAKGNNIDAKDVPKTDSMIEFIYQAFI